MRVERGQDRGRLRRYLDSRWSRRTFLGKVKDAATIAGAIYVTGETGNVVATAAGMPPQIGRSIAHATIPEPARDVLDAGAQAAKGWMTATQALEGGAATVLHVAEVVAEPTREALKKVKDLIEKLPGDTFVENGLVDLVEGVDALLGGIDNAATSLETSAQDNRTALKAYAYGESFPGALHAVMGDDPLPKEKPQEEEKK